MIKVRKVAPIGKRTSPAFVERESGCSFEMMEFDVYAPNSKREELHEARLAVDLSFSEAAKLAGLRASEWCGLENGSLEPENWDEVFALLKTKEKP